MPSEFQYDVFLSHSSRDKVVVHPLAERLRADGLRVWLDDWEIRPGDSIPAKIEEGLEQSRVLVLCMSANAFGSDWAKLEAGTFRFRDPLNKERRFIPLRLDESPIKGSLSQLLYITWHPEDIERSYAKLLETCQPPAQSSAGEARATSKRVADKAIQLNSVSRFNSYAFSLDGKRFLTGAGDLPGSRGRGGATGAGDYTIRLWDLETGISRELKRLSEGGTKPVKQIEFKGERLDMTSVMRWRENVLGQTSS